MKLLLACALLTVVLTIAHTPPVILPSSSPIRTTIILLSPPHSRNSSSIIYPLTFARTSQHLAIGLKSMHWTGPTSIEGPQGWNAQLKWDEERVNLVVRVLESQWMWWIQLSVIAVEKQKGLVSLSEVAVWSRYTQNGQSAGQITLKNPIKMQTASQTSLVLPEIKPIILLNALSLDPSCTLDPNKKILIDLEVSEYSADIIKIRGNNSGIMAFSYSVLFFRVEQLLKQSISVYLRPQHSYQERSPFQPQIQVLSLIKRYTLTPQKPQQATDLQQQQYYSGLMSQNPISSSQTLAQNSQLMDIQLTHFKCKQFWSLPHSTCQPTCTNFLAISTNMICLDSKRILVSCAGYNTLCLSCVMNFATQKKNCVSCNIGYYVDPTSIYCQKCPVGCYECLYKQKMPKDPNEVHCDSCVNNFYKSKDAPHICLCPTGNYPDSTTSTCLPCPGTCTVCTSASTCTSCLTGYILSGGSCINCLLPVCKTCTASGSTCTSCVNNLVMSGSTCVCPANKYLNPGTLTCITCTAFDANCLSCGYNPTYSTSAPNPIKCLTPATGYFVQANGTTAQCGANCDICTSASVCTTCSSTYTLSGNICVCSPLFLTNSAPFYCDNCSVIVFGCDICTTAGTTQCSSCLHGYYPSSAPPAPSCLACPLTCDGCTSSTVCTGCLPSFMMTGSLCLCAGVGQFVDVSQIGCDLCPNIIFNCINCISALPTTCSLCSTGFSPATDGLSCISCPLNCYNCTSSTVCDTCNPGYAWNGVVCDCDLTCQNCLNLTGGACSACTNATDCSGCAAGWFLSGSTCQLCMPSCLACTGNSTCISCALPFTLDTSNQCVCNNAADSFLSINGSTCQPCATVISDCSGCSFTFQTICDSCDPGFYLDTMNNLCKPCSYPCTTCNTTATQCTGCVSTYALNSTSNTCFCNDTSGMFYKPSYEACLDCTVMITNCLSCQINGTDPNITDCLTCADPYYSDPVTFTCVLCDKRCTQCTDLVTCSACATNLIPNNSFCECNTTADPDLAYNAQTNICVGCLGLLSNCLACDPQPLACTVCLDGTYVNNSVCVVCPSECATCNQTGCLTCPPGITLSNYTCTCGSACQTCLQYSLNCISCTFSPTDPTILLACNSCQTGSWLDSNGITCNLCPTSCLTCTSATTCTACLDTFTLNGVNCQCDTSLNLFLSDNQCLLCGDIYFGCVECQFTGSTVCIDCVPGMFVNGSQCSYCDPSCADCSSLTICTGCPSGMTLVGSSCTCGATCTNCASNVTGCTACDLTLLGAFSQCTTCQGGLYLDSSSTCQTCPTYCVTCSSASTCTSCSPTLHVINGNCSCQQTKHMFLNIVTNLCEDCLLTFDHCARCQTNYSTLLGYQCAECDHDYYIVNQTCVEEVCGDGVVSPSEECDDNNTIAGDGCNTGCLVQTYYVCQFQPSICRVEAEFSIAYDSVQVSSTVCNQLTLFFNVRPIYQSYSRAQFEKMYQFNNATNLLLNTSEFTYTAGVVGLIFNYTGDLVGTTVNMLFMPRFIGIQQTNYVPLYPVTFQIGQSINSVALRYLSADVCHNKDVVNTYVDAVEYASYGVLILSALPAKIVGLELFGVLQLCFLSLGSIDHLNPLQASLTKLSSTNGLSLTIDDQEPTNTRLLGQSQPQNSIKKSSSLRLLQSSALTSNRIQTIGYASNFIRNCNVMIILVAAVMLVSFVLYILTCFCTCCPCLYGFTRRFFKELLLTLILFNCFNFSFCAGLHFAYASHDDSLYLWGSLAAVAAILVPLMMTLVLQCTQEQGFGEYKDKLKDGRVEKAYFMITIFYRMGIGFYMSTMNQDVLSTLIVLLISVYFIIYNLVNLPFKKAYHNYRANVCHLSQFSILFIAMYYRSMNEGASIDQLNTLFNPVYFQLSALGLCLLVSFIVLMVDIYFWVREMREECCSEKEEQEKSRVNIGSSDGNDKVQNEATLENINLGGQNYHDLNNTILIKDKQQSSKYVESNNASFDQFGIFDITDV